MLKQQNRQWTKRQRYRLKQVAWVNIVAQILFPVAGAFTPAVAATRTGDEIDVPPSQSRQILADSLKQAASHDDPPANTGDNTERWLASAASRAAGMLKSGNLVDSTKSQLRGMAVSEANQAVQNWLQRYGTVKLQANVDDRGRLDGSQFDMLLPLYDTEKRMAFTQFGLRHIDSRTTANWGLGQRHFLDGGMFGYNAFLDHDITRDHTRFGVGAEYARDFMKFGANGYFRASGWKDGKKLKDYDERPANGFDLRGEGYIPAYPQLGGKLIYEQYFGDEVGLLSETRRQKNPAAFTLGMNYTPIPLVTLGLDRKQSTSGGGETLFNLGLNYEIGTPWSRQVDPSVVAFKRSLQGGRYDLVERNNQIVLEYRKKNLIRLMMENRISGRGGAVIPLNINVSAKHGLKEIVWDTAGLVAGGGKLESVNASARTAGFAAEPVRGGTHYLLTLPPFHEKGNNTYTLSGIAYDTQGNASDRMETQIQVLSSAVNPAGSGFEPANKSMVADGKTQTVIRLKLTDKDGKPVTGAAGNIKLTDDKTKLTGDGKDPALGTEVKEVPEGSGIYEVTATAGTKHGKWTIKPNVDGHALTPTVIDFGDSLANMIDTDRTEFKPEAGTLSKEGDTTDIILNLKDKDGNPITGAADKITLDKDNSELYGEPPYPSLGEVREDPTGSGIYKAKVTAGKKKGTWKITPNVDGKALKPAIITFGQSLTDIVDTKGSQFTPETNVLAANNEDSTVLTLHLKDKSGNPIPNAKDSITFEDNGDTLTGDGKNKPTIDKVWEEPAGSGIYKVKVKAGDKTGSWKITTKVEGKPLETPTEITFGASKAELVDPDKSEFVAEKGDLPNEGDTTIIRLNLKDINGHPITGAENSINLIPDNHELYGKGETLPAYGKAREVPPGSGLYEVPVTAGAKKGKWTLTPEVFGKRLKRPATINFGQTLADILDSNSPTVEPTDGSNALAADGVSTKTLRVVLKDKQGKPVTGAKDSIRVSASGQLQGEGKDPQISDVKEVSDGVYEVVVTAGRKTGNWTLTTAVDGTDRKQETVIEFDENKAPGISGLQLEGVLHVNGVLHALYQFEAKGGNTTDRSFYVWGEKGTTAKRVMKLADEAGVKEPIELVQKNGEGRVATGAADKDKVKYTIESSDIGKVLEVSILAANEANLRANAPLTADVNDPKFNQGITGSNGNGGVADPKAKPGIEQIVLSGELEINKPLTAQYTFKDNGGDATDLSQFAWHEKGTTVAEADYQAVPDSGKNAQNKTGTLSKTLAQDDAGKTLAITVKPINGNSDQGEPKTVDISMTDSAVNKTTSMGGKPGTILDPAAKPSIDKLLLEGRLYLNETLKAKYEFNPNNGDVTDNSTYVWKRLRPENKNGGPREEVQDPEAKGTVDGKKILSGDIPSYTLGKEDTGRLLEITITPKNGLKEIGTDAVINTGQDHTLIGGTDDGAIIDPNRGPIIEGLTINGTLEVGQSLTGSYIFKKNDKDDVDNSVYLWGIKYSDIDDPNAPTSPEKRINDLVNDPDHHITISETVPPYILEAKDSGRIIQLAMVPRSPLKSDGDKMMLGKTVATDSEQEAKKGNVTGGNQDGTVKGIADDFSVDADKTTAKAKIDLVDNIAESIELTIKTQKDKKPIGGVPVTIKMTATNRQNGNETPTVKLDIEKGILYDKGGVLSGNTKTYSGHTDENGDFIIKVTDPNGKGVKTTLKVTAEGASGALTEQTKNVTFTVITSPDVSVANYWGHMFNTISAGGMTFNRPTLKAELAGDTPSDHGLINNEEWTTVATDNVIKFCSDRGLRTPYASEYQTLANQYNAGAENIIYKKYGWLKNWSYYAYDKFTSGEHPGYRKKVNLGDGSLTYGYLDNPVACRNK
ncbi:inverse autotransporter beta domain-containing protein [Xenorhabdus miraniensis]|uniref:Putative invasin n=1 Tax=Xenorhabdus miraniensis TaxID=351674 RepID=A0A2D0JNT5_9GAMM|nr:inverse autotransporter beta domain-containing protein [Xenorhabdus miraniensis]PHM47336.1 putative invasin [Xenorhabdus miraniensis]PHM47978.1 putative invasin [Xenorhabdus miraniensis]